MHIKLTKIQREVLVGVLLGDGNLQTFTNGRTFRLRILHSITQKYYVEHLYKIFNNFITMPIITQQVKEASDRVYFNTKNHPSLRYYAKLFYKNEVKTIPKNIHKLISARSLAYWFMDDGSRKGLKYKGYRLCTDCYSKKEVKLLCTALLYNFNIKCTTFKQRKKWRLYIVAESSDKFEEIIYPFILQEFISSKFHMHSKYY